MKEGNTSHILTGEVSMRRPLSLALTSMMLACAMVVVGQTPAPQTPSPSPPTFTPEWRKAIEEIDGMMAAEYAKSNVGSITVGIVAGANLVWTKSYGYADMEKKVPATKETVYRIGGTTKEFTGLMLLQLVEQGKVRLSDPVEKYYPEVNKIPRRFPDAPPITFAQLATHTSGIALEPTGPPEANQGPVADWEKSLVAALPYTKYEYEPGAYASYSNIGYAILGAALSRVAKQPYVDYMRQQVFAPLGMTHTDFEPNAQLLPYLAKGYQVDGDKIDTETPLREHQGRGYKVPVGAIYTTVEDMARFVSLQLGEGPVSVIKKQTLKNNHGRLIALQSNLYEGWGVGLQVIRRLENGQYFFGYAGGIAGYEASARYDPASGTGFILLCSLSDIKVHRSMLTLTLLINEKLAALGRKPAR
jgi:CubicO group peptidase (beta-lactamase class C family)